MEPLPKPLKPTKLGNTTDHKFQTGKVLTIVGAHFVHDVYTAFLAPLLPLIIEKLSLSLAQAGGLSAFLQFPAVINPLIGFLADRVDLRYFLILSPAVTATLMSSLGMGNNYLSLVIILLLTGVSSASFHAPAPAMIARLSGKQVGKGMGMQMAAGELGRTIGPLLVVWAVSQWTLEGIFRLSTFGWAASILLFFRLRNKSYQPEIRGSIRAILPQIKKIFPPIIVFVFFRNFVSVSVTTYLPTYLIMNGEELSVAGWSLAILEFAGVIGALMSGTLSDRFGRKPVLYAAILGSSLFLIVFVNTSGIWLIPVLLVLGFTTLSTVPVLLSIVQDAFPKNRALANSLLMFFSFLIRPIHSVSIGYMGDIFGLRSTFIVGTGLCLLAILGVVWLPKEQNSRAITK
jgi:FSR family fosmidomycin resistance protein-like MFS transporter